MWKTEHQLYNYKHSFWTYSQAYRIKKIIRQSLKHVNGYQKQLKMQLYISKTTLKPNIFVIVIIVIEASI